MSSVLFVYINVSSIETFKDRLQFFIHHSMQADF